MGEPNALWTRSIWVFVGGLQPPSTATVVRSNAGETSMTDGPYAESKEQMRGFWVIEVPDRTPRSTPPAIAPYRGA